MTSNGANGAKSPKGAKAARPRRVRRFRNFTRNTLRILFLDSLRGWRRELGTFTPAIGAMALLLLLLGGVSMVGLAGINVLKAQTQQAAVLHVYLRDSTTDEPLDLEARLKSDRRVKSVVYISKSAALARAQQHPGLSDLAQASDSNPFPASLEVQVARVDDVAAVDSSVRNDPSVDPQLPSSYDAATFSRIKQALVVIEAIGAGLLVVVLLVAVGVTGATIRGVVLSRRDELAVMRLVGAPGWMIRGPFAVQGAATGMVAGLVAGIAVLGLSAAALEAAQVSFLRWLPGFTVEMGLVAAGATVVVGIGLGTIASLVELRGIR